MTLLQNGSGDEAPPLHGVRRLLQHSDNDGPDMSLTTALDSDDEVPLSIDLSTAPIPDIIAKLPGIGKKIGERIEKVRSQGADFTARSVRLTHYGP